MTSSMHTFDNGVRVLECHLSEAQRTRYRSMNVHEADEEILFLRLLDDLPQGGVFVNAGAAIGYYPILAKRQRPDLSVHALEPLDEHRKHMAANIALNNLPTDGIVIHSCGLARHDGGAILDVQSFNSRVCAARLWSVRGAKAGVKRLLNSLGLGSYRIPQQRIDVISLQSLVDRLQGRIDLLQIDIQGLEADVLEAGRHPLLTGAVRTLLIGTHGSAIHRRCKDVLSAAGYAIEYSDPSPADQPDGILVASRVRQPRREAGPKGALAGCSP